MIKKIAKLFLSEKARLNIHYSFFKFNSYFYKGDNVYCICCDKSFKKFLPHGNIPRANAACPYCHSLERTKLLMYYLQNETEIFKVKQKILHFAPERAISRKIKPFNNSEYITADINPSFADHIVDIQNIPYENESFNLIICSHVLGHIPDEPKAINEMYRVLKPGGKAIILTLIDLNRNITYENKSINTSKERLMHYGESDLLRLHGNDFISRLSRDGINVEAIDYSLIFNETEKERFHIGNKEREIIFLCKK